MGAERRRQVAVDSGIVPLLVSSINTPYAEKVCIVIRLLCGNVSLETSMAMKTERRKEMFLASDGLPALVRLLSGRLEFITRNKALSALRTVMQGRDRVDQAVAAGAKREWFETFHIFI